MKEACLPSASMSSLPSLGAKNSPNTKNERGRISDFKVRACRHEWHSHLL